MKSSKMQCKRRLSQQQMRYKVVERAALNSDIFDVAVKSEMAIKVKEVPQTYRRPMTAVRPVSRGVQSFMFATRQVMTPCINRKVVKPILFNTKVLYEGHREIPKLRKGRKILLNNKRAYISRVQSQYNFRSQSVCSFSPVSSDCILQILGCPALQKCVR